MPFEVTVELETGSPAEVGIGGLVVLAKRVMEGEGCAPGSSLTCLLTDDRALRSLNRQFLGIDEPTDVLAFPDEPDSEFILGQDDATHLGDIAISVERAAAQAADYGHPVAMELSHLLVHGILHLCGYDHTISADEEGRMRTREELYLGALNGHGHSS